MADAVMRTVQANFTWGAVTEMLNLFQFLHLILTWRKIAASAVRHSVGCLSQSLFNWIMTYLLHIFLLWTFWHRGNISHQMGPSEQPTSIMLLGAITAELPLSSLLKCGSFRALGGFSVWSYRWQLHHYYQALRTSNGESAETSHFTSNVCFLQRSVLSDTWIISALTQKRTWESRHHQLLSVCVCRSDKLVDF